MGQKQRVSWSKVAVLIFVVAVVFVGAKLYLSKTGKINANARDVEQVALGQTLYGENCAVCHGANLEGQPNWRVRKPNDRLPAPPHNEEGHTWHHPDDLLFGITKFGLKPPVAPADYETDMPSFEDILSDEEIWAVLAFIKSTWPSQVQERQNSLSDGSSQQ